MALLAKVAEQAERYEEMVEFMTTASEESAGNLSVEERNLLSVAYKNVVGARRASWRILRAMSDQEQADKGSSNKLQELDDYRVKVGDTKRSLARFFKVPVSRLKNAEMTPGKLVRFKANVWSHKRGWGGKPLLVDAKGKAIMNPLTASRDYGGGLNYSKYCHSYCVKRTGVDVGKTGSKVVKKCGKGGNCVNVKRDLRLR